MATAVSSLQCKTEIPQVPGLPEGELSVGREFLLVCDGDFPKGLIPEKIQFVLKPEQKYQIHLLGFEFRSPTQADLKVTAYKAGPIRFDDLQITDGTEVLSLGALQYQVQSVLPPQEPGQAPVKTEAYGPMGPVSLSVPPFYWAMIAGVLGLAILIFLTKILRIVQRRNMLSSLREHESALTPLAQFHQSLRRLQRQNKVFFGGRAELSEMSAAIDETHKVFKLYLTRRFQLPALEWSDRLILNDLKKYHKKIYVEFQEELRKTLKELQRGLQDKDKLTEQDVINVTTRARLLVEKIERFQ